MTAPSSTFAGWFLIVVGVIYLLKPDIFRRGIWKRTSIAQRTLSPEGYLKYMRWVGVVTIVIGILFLFWGHAKA
jgi:uncharacterized protein YjeT (DUF2065 family)